MRAIVRHVLRPALSPSLPIARQRAVVDGAARLSRLPGRVERQRLNLGGRPAELHASSPDSQGQRAILYLHGGAFVVGGLLSHRALAANVALGSGCPVYVLDYRLAPEHAHPAAVDDAEAAFRELGAQYDEVAVAGDSAGGWLVLALAMRLRDAGDRAAVALGLISPLIDLTHARLVVDRDDMLTRAWTEFGGQAYAGGTPAEDLSAKVDDLAGLPPAVIHVGPDEMLRPDAEWLAAGLGEVGVPVELRVIPRMWHVWHLHAGLFAEATDSAREMGAALSAEARPR
jgi:acetyl esterase/lipase